MWSVRPEEKEVMDAGGRVKRERDGGEKVACGKE